MPDTDPLASVASLYPHLADWPAPTFDDIYFQSRLWAVDNYIAACWGFAPRD